MCGVVDEYENMGICKKKKKKKRSNYALNKIGVYTVKMQNVHQKMETSLSNLHNMLPK